MSHPRPTFRFPLSTFRFPLSVFLLLLLLVSCKPAQLDKHFAAGTIEQPLPTDSEPDDVRIAMDCAKQYQCSPLLSCDEEKIAVACIDAAGETSTQGYGIQMTKGDISTIFPYMRHTRQPQAHYDAAAGDLWLTGSAMEGTGVHVEWLYQVRFGDNDIAYVKCTVNPYDVQQQLLQRLSYTIKGQVITLYDGDKELAVVTNSITDMGGFDDEQPLWIGEQLYYDLSGCAPQLVFVPGIKYTTGLVLTYDDMPELRASLTLDDQGHLTIGAIIP